MTGIDNVMNLGELLAQVARRLPDQPGFIRGDQHVTWSKLLRRVDSVAAALRARGLNQGDRFVVDHGGAGAYQFAVRGLQCPAQFTAEQVDTDGLASVGSRGQHRGCTQGGRQMAGKRIGATEMAGKHRNSEFSAFVENDDRRVGFF